VSAVGAALPGAGWQRCRTHYLRNLLSKVPKSAQPWVATLVRTVFDQPDADAVRAQYARVVTTIEAKFPAAAEHLDAARDDLLAFTAFPREIWRQIWSNNPQERLNKEIRRRTDVVGIFPNRAAVIRLVGAVLAEQTDEWTEARRYMGLELLTKARRPSSTAHQTNPPATPGHHRNQLLHRINPDLHGDRLLHHSRGRDLGCIPPWEIESALYCQRQANPSIGLPSTSGLSPKRCFWPDSPDLRFGGMGTVSNDRRDRGSTEEACQPE
jgi:putative transposase